MPQHYNKKGGFLKDSMMINVHPEPSPQKAKKKPEPMPIDEHIRPPVIDSGIELRIQRLSVNDRRESHPTGSRGFDPLLGSDDEVIGCQQITVA